MTTTKSSASCPGPKVAAALVASAVIAIFVTSLVYRVQNPGMQKIIRPYHAASQAGGMPSMPGAGDGEAPGMGMDAVRAMLESLRARVAKEPGDVEALLQLAKIQRMRGDTAAAAGYMDAALESVGGNPNALHELAGMYYDMQQNDKAMRVLKMLLVGHPDDAFAHFNLGVLYRYRLKDPGKAEEQYRAVLELPGGEDVKEQARTELETLGKDK